MNYIEEHNIKPIPTHAFYKLPWTLTILSRNEIKNSIKDQVYKSGLIDLALPRRFFACCLQSAGARTYAL